MNTKYLPKARKALEALYTSRCNVVVYGEEKEGSITKHREKTVYEDIPCKLSFELSYPLEQTEQTAVSSQRVKLFTAPEITVPQGSKVTVATAEGEILHFAYSGECSCYSTHKEVRLRPMEREK